MADKTAKQVRKILRAIRKDETKAPKFANKLAELKKSLAPEIAAKYTARYGIKF